LVGLPLMAVFPRLSLMLRIIFVLYLMLLAWRLWRMDPRLHGDDRRPVTWAQAFVTTLLNPKGLIFGITIFPAFSGLADLMLHAGIFAFLVVTTGSGWMIFGSILKRFDRGDMPRLVPRMAAVALGAVAGLIILH
ncbi:MAG TPA: hypothetical protein VKT70_13465, partial [Stellaceae bacterium]|nr:hypothetical protein [Stellaceae bacterium]